MLGLLYAPAVYVIERFGVNKATIVGLAFTIVGVWLVEAKDYTIGLILLGVGAPFLYF